MARKKNKPKTSFVGTSTHRTARRVRQGPRPPEDWVEVQSDEEEENANTTRRGAARGLNQNNILPSPTAETVEISDDEDQPAKIEETVKHDTRSARNGPSNINYDTKVSNRCL